MRTRDHFSAISHLIGAVFSLVAVILLIMFAAQKRELWQVVGFSVFGASLLLLYTTSSLYHFFHIGSRTRRVFQRLDHSFIYLLIAGTLTPLCLTVLRGPWGWTLLSIIWASAIIGIVVKNVWGMPSWASTTLYVLMGWLVIVAIVPLWHALSLSAIAWLFAGGILYTLGAVLFALDERYPSHRWFNLHDLFHLFVIGGSVSHIMFMQYLL